jgi:hypothetical protein
MLMEKIRIKAILLKQIKINTKDRIHLGPEQTPSDRILVRFKRRYLLSFKGQGQATRVLISHIMIRMLANN